MNWELIKLRLVMGLSGVTIVLLSVALLVGIAELLSGGSLAVGLYLISGMLVLVLAINIFQWLFGPYMINAAYRAHEVTQDDPSYGWLVDLVSEVARDNGFSKPPKVYIAEAPFPNAFAYGSPIAGRRVAITRPALRLLNKDELAAVLGHELGHLRHRDVELLMAIGLIPALIYWLGYSLMWSGIWGGAWGERGNNGLSLMAIGVALLGVSFLFQFVLLYMNRLREAYADVNSALTVPNAAKNLQRALAKITLYMDPRTIAKIKKSPTNNMVKMLFFAPTDDKIVREASDADVEELIEYWRSYKPKPWEDILSDHPHPAKRIQLLDKISQSQ
ncbi:heat-shock protein HtpX [Thermocladium modestius]|uniref:Protease HtpX homolog n=1 Tax=Thermocladium modestius TaxID=62609 RepID=A0A830GXX3_9CREN|nr:zinc metalloprotease HtpX [Thermocladium modestius]GGP21496.1 heat-shock protein HtpX [Thermocladium modestius]